MAATELKPRDHGQVSGAGRVELDDDLLSPSLAGRLLTCRSLLVWAPAGDVWGRERAGNSFLLSASLAAREAGGFLSFPIQRALSLQKADE